MRIDIRGLFLMTGTAAPLAQPVRRMIHDLVRSHAGSSIDAATVVLAETLSINGETHRQCELVGRASNGQRLRVVGTGRTVSEAAVACVSQTFPLSPAAVEASLAQESRNPPSPSTLEVTQSC